MEIIFRIARVSCILSGPVVRCPTTHWEGWWCRRNWYSLLRALVLIHSIYPFYLAVYDCLIESTIASCSSPRKSLLHANMSKKHNSNNDQIALHHLNIVLFCHLVFHMYAHAHFRWCNIVHFYLCIILSFVCRRSARIPFSVSSKCSHTHIHTQPTVNRSFFLVLHSFFHFKLSLLYFNSAYPISVAWKVMRLNCLALPFLLFSRNGTKAKDNEKQRHCRRERECVYVCGCVCVLVKN